MSNCITPITKTNSPWYYGEPAYIYHTVIVNPIEDISPEEIKILLTIMNGLVSIMEIERRSCEKYDRYLMDYCHIQNDKSFELMNEIRWNLSRLRSMYYCNDSPNLWKNLSETFDVYINAYAKKYLNKSNNKSLEDFCDSQYNLDLKIYECRLLLKVVSMCL